MQAPPSSNRGGEAQQASHTRQQHLNMHGASGRSRNLNLICRRGCCLCRRGERAGCLASSRRRSGCTQIAHGAHRDGVSPPVWCCHSAPSSSRLPHSLGGKSWPGARRNLMPPLVHLGTGQHSMARGTKRRLGADVSMTATAVPAETVAEEGSPKRSRRLRCRAQLRMSTGELSAPMQRLPASAPSGPCALHRLAGSGWGGGCRADPPSPPVLRAGVSRHPYSDWWRQHMPQPTTPHPRAVRQGLPLLCSRDVHNATPRPVGAVCCLLQRGRRPCESTG